MGEGELPPDRDEAGRMLMKRCPDCAELVKPDARICRYCRFDFEAGLGADGEARSVELPKEEVAPPPPQPFALQQAWSQLEAGHTKLALDQAFAALQVQDHPAVLSDLAAFAATVIEHNPSGQNHMRGEALAARISQKQIQMGVTPSQSPATSSADAPANVTSTAPQPSPTGPATAPTALSPEAAAVRTGRMSSATRAVAASWSKLPKAAKAALVVVAVLLLLSVVGSALPSKDTPTYDSPPDSSGSSSRSVGFVEGKLRDKFGQGDCDDNGGGEFRCVIGPLLYVDVTCIPDGSCKWRDSATDEPIRKNVYAGE